MRRVLVLLAACGGSQPAAPPPPAAPAVVAHEEAPKRDVVAEHRKLEEQQQDALAANAQAVLSLGKELHGRLATMGAHLSRLGRAIENAATAYNQTVGSLETRVLVSARRFADLGVVEGGLEAPAPVDPRLATVGAAELVASVSEQVVALEDVRGEGAVSAVR